jgi:hypothetical protein
MSAISIDKLIPVTSNVVNSGFTGVTLAGLYLTTNDNIPINSTNIVLSFTSAELVGNYFGMSSPEYLASVKYFTSYTTKVKTPPFILFARRVNANTSAWIRSGTAPVLTALQSITSGAMTFNFNGTTQALTAVNLSTATSFSQVAGIIQTKLQVDIPTATVVYDSTLQAFIADDGLSTGASTITYCASTPLADAMKMTATTGAVLSQASTALSVAANMALVTTITTNWAGISTIYDAASTSPYTEALDIAAWVTGQNKKYYYTMWSQESNLLIVGNTSNISPILESAQYDNLFPVYGTTDHASFFMGIVASIDYNRQNGTISIASKSQAGLLPSCTTDTEYDALVEKKFNFYGKFSARAETYFFSETGKSYGDLAWLDNIANNIWLDDQLQNVIATLFQNSGKIPNNAKGYQTLKSALNDAMQQATFNGVAETGNLFDGTVTSVLTAQAGYDITPQLTSKGYVIQVVPVTASQRGTRTPPTTNIWYSNGGSINSLPINVTYVF